MSTFRSALVSVVLVLPSSCVRAQIHIPMAGEECEEGFKLEQQVRTVKKSMENGKDVRVAWIARQLRDEFPERGATWAHEKAQRVWDVAYARVHDPSGKYPVCEEEPAEATE